MSGELVIDYSWFDPEFGLLLTQSDLIRRGWTKAAIERELGEPDRYGRNPRGGAYVRLYDARRVNMARRPANSDYQAWMNELVETIEVVAAHDDRLREFLLDYVDFDSAFYAGRSPDQALTETFAMLKSNPDIFAGFLARG